MKRSGSSKTSEASSHSASAPKKRAPDSSRSSASRKYGYREPSKERNGDSVALANGHSEVSPPLVGTRVSGISSATAMPVVAAEQRASSADRVADADSSATLKMKKEYRKGAKKSMIAVQKLATDVDPNDDIFDPACDPRNPVQVSIGMVSKAAFYIKDGIVRTACPAARKLSEMTGVSLFLKKEFQQVSGSFKERGARNVLLQLTDEQKAKGVVAASAGNHALALAYHGSLLGIHVVVYMPTTAPIMKIMACKDHGAEVRQIGKNLAEAKTCAMRFAKENGMLYINGYDHPEIIAGQGTMGLEIMEQVGPTLDAVIIPMGGGGLLAGTAVAVKHLNPKVKIIAVESLRAQTLSRSLDAGGPTRTDVGSTISDGLAVPLMGCNAYATCAHLIDKVVAVDEGQIALAILRLVEIEKAVVEGAGATGLAALLKEGLLPELAGKRVCVALTGGNIDTTVLGRCLERGLATDGRLGRVVVTVSDRPGGISELTKMIAKCGASIKDILHERAWLMTDIFSVRVRVTVETRDRDHYMALIGALRESYADVACDVAF